MAKSDRSIISTCPISKPDSKNVETNARVSFLGSSLKYSSIIKKTDYGLPSYVKVGISSETFHCQNQEYLALGTSDPFGVVLIHKILSDDIEFVLKIKSQTPDFGGKFGYGIAKVRTHTDDFLVISSPFEEHGKLEVVDVCSALANQEPVIDQNTNYYYPISFPELEFLGYSLENIGNVDGVTGDEIAVGFPSKKGGVLIFSYSNNGFDMVFRQKIESNNIKAQMGISIGNSLQVDSKAGKDIPVGGNERAWVFQSQQTIGLKNSPRFFTEVRDLDMNNLPDKITFEKICVELESNFDIDNQDLFLEVSTKHVLYEFEKSLYPLEKNLESYCTGELVAAIKSQENKCGILESYNEQLEATFSIEKVTSKTNTETNTNTETVFNPNQKRMSHKIKISQQCGDCRLKLNSVAFSGGENIKEKLSRNSITREVDVLVANNKAFTL